MRKFIVSLVILSLLALSLPARPAVAQAPNPLEGCVPASVPGAVLCNPAGATDWIIFVHGYVPAGAPPGAAWLQLVLPDGQTIPQLVNGLGYGFAAAEFGKKNGLAIQEGVADTLALANALKTPTNHIYLFGASEGGLITTLISEGNGAFVNGLTNPISGAVSACGPNGDFRKQVDYFGDFRVLFDYFFRGVLPGSKWDGHLGGFTPVNVDPEVTADWISPLFGGVSTYRSLVTAAIANPANAGKVEQLMRTAKAAVDPANPATAVVTALSVLNYDVVGINDATNTLGVQPFTNTRTWYFGSSNDFLLNNPLLGVERIRSNDALINQQIAPYQTTGRLTRPLVTIHTTLDPEVPIWHQILYRLKVWTRGSAALYSGIPIPRYGHCNFKPEEVAFAFYLMVFKSVGLRFSASQVAQALPDAASQAGFEALQRQFSADDALNGPPPVQIFIPLITNP
ncbi:MAG TPA: hypothetical protein PJ988_06580 [Anaerolinea sp.]|nr:hypothetical protein [Anaerolinea sp.]